MSSSSSPAGVSLRISTTAARGVPDASADSWVGSGGTGCTARVRIRSASSPSVTTAPPSLTSAADPPPSALDVSTGLHPFADPPCHRRHVVVSHVMHGLGREHRAVPARTVDDDLGVSGDPLFDGRLDDAAGQERGLWDMAEVPLILLADVEIDRVVASGLHGQYVGDRDLLDALSGFADQFGTALIGHFGTRRGGG